MKQGVAAGLPLDEGKSISASEMQAGRYTEPGPCPARALSQTIRWTPDPRALEFRLRRCTGINAISGVSCVRGNLKSGRLYRAVLPHRALCGGKKGQLHLHPLIVVWTHVSSAFTAS